MRRNVVVAVVSMLIGFTISLLGVVIPLVTRRGAGLTTEYETLPVWATLLAFVLFLFGVMLFAAELASGALTEMRSRRRKLRENRRGERQLAESQVLSVAERKSFYR